MAYIQHMHTHCKQEIGSKLVKLNNGTICPPTKQGELLLTYTHVLV